MSNKDPDWLSKLVKAFIKAARPEKAKEQVIINLNSCKIEEIPGLVRLLWYIEERKTTAEKDVKYPEGDDSYLLNTLEDLVSYLIGKGDLKIPEKIANSQFNGISETVLEEIKLDIEYTKSALSSYTAEFAELVTKFTADGSFTFTRTGLIIGTVLYGEKRYRDANSYAKSLLPIAKQRNQEESFQRLMALEKATSAELKRQRN